MVRKKYIYFCQNTDKKYIIFVMDYLFKIHPIFLNVKESRNLTGEETLK